MGGAQDPRGHRGTGTGTGTGTGEGKVRFGGRRASGGVRGVRGCPCMGHLSARAAAALHANALPTLQCLHAVRKPHSSEATVAGPCFMTRARATLAAPVLARSRPPNVSTQHGRAAQGGRVQPHRWAISWSERRALPPPRHPRMHPSCPCPPLLPSDADGPRPWRR